MKFRKQRRQHLTVPEKTNRLLSGIIVALAIISVRIWHVAVVEHDQKLEEAYKPQRRVIPELVERATICDRFGKVLAENKMQYDVCVSYGGIRDLPSRAWRVCEDGSRELVPVRKQYITRLSELLAQELHLDKDMIEDAIHAKASILGSVPFLIQSNVSERTYLRLKMMAKHWPGLHVEPSIRRYYPMGKLASGVLGYVGPISAQEYKRATQELSKLRECVRAYEEGEDPKFPDGMASIDQVRSLLNAMENNAYSLNSLVGKLGVEAYFDAQLRGKIGRKTVLVDRRGNFIQGVSETPAVAGKRLQLTLSAELQAYAESLLAEHERMDQFRSQQSLKKRKLLPPLFPWIKGGAIIALNPNNGQVLAMASSPRYQNNDFIDMQVGVDSEARSDVYRWLENVEHVAEVYDHKVPLRRERYNTLTGAYYDEELFLTFDYYLDFILPNTSELKEVIKQLGTVGNAVQIQNSVERLLQLFAYEEGKCLCSSVFDAVFPAQQEHIPLNRVVSIREQEWIASCCEAYEQEIQQIKEELDPFFADLPANYDKMLFVDLCRMVIDPHKVDIELLPFIASLSLSDFFECQGHYIAWRSAFVKIVEDIFTEVDFKSWRATHFAKYLEGKREAEAARKQRYPTPYVDYLLEAKREQYQEFQSQYIDPFLVYLLSGYEHDERLREYYDGLKVWKEELENGAHQALPWHDHYAFLKQKFADVSFDLRLLFSAFRSFSDLQRPLYGQYSPMITRNTPQKEQDLAAAFYPTYGYGYLRPHAFAQAATLGSIFKLVSAYSVLSQEVMAGNENVDYLSRLLVIIDRQSFGYTTRKSHVGFFKDGSFIPSFYRGGILPKNDYLGRGKIDLISALEMSSNPYFSLLVGDYLADPEDLAHAASLFGFGEKTGVGLPGEYAGYIPQDLAYNRSGLYATAIGQHTLIVTPLQTASMLSTLVNGGSLYIPNLILGEWEGEEFIPMAPMKKRDVFMPECITRLLKSGMHNVIWGNYGTTRGIRDQFDASFLNTVVGKTSTAETVIRVGLDRQHGNMKMKHVWFGAIGFTEAELVHPDIVVVVYLRLGEFGRDAAPMAVKMIEKWREIQKEQNFSLSS